MNIINGKAFTAQNAWGSKPIASMNGISVKLHWTDKPYKWHVNEGEEVFAVLDGVVEMFYRVQGKEMSTMLKVGDIFHASIGIEHVAYPVGEARILVIESEGSV